MVTMGNLYYGSCKLYTMGAVKPKVDIVLKLL